MTFQRLANLAFFDIGAIQSGETPNSDESTDALDTANHILSTWSLEGVTCYNRKHYTVATNLGAVTIGPTGNWNTTARPVKIEGAVCFSGTFRKPMRVVGFAEYSQITGDDVGKTQVLAEVLGVDDAYPLLNGRLWPATTGVASIELHTLEALTAIASLVTVIDLPPGHEAALRSVLAVALYPQYGRQGGIDPAVAAAAQNAKAVIAQVNAGIAGMPAAPQQQQ